jgi:hypothetical protein
MGEGGERRELVTGAICGAEGGVVEDAWRYNWSRAMQQYLENLQQDLV